MGPDAGDRPDLSFAHDLPLTQAALDFASARHAGQRRAGDDALFVLHPAEVAAQLELSGYPDRVVAAAVLHDVLEDTDAERSDLERNFGPDVAELVEAVSDDPSMDDVEQRKDAVRDEVRRRDGYAAAVYAADKVSKVRELRTRMARGERGEEVEAKFRRYHRSLAMLEETIPGDRLVELLRFELEALEQLPPGPAARPHGAPNGGRRGG